MRSFYAILICICSGAKAQEPPHFLENFTTREGLSSNNITDILQDDQGLLWIATTDGLNRFDGTAITHFFQQENSNSIPHNSVYCLYKLPNNVIAIGTRSGLSFYNIGLKSFTNFYYDSQSALDEYNNIISLLETDSHGNLWAASKNCIFVFDKNLKLKRTFFSSFKESDASKQRLRFVEKMIPWINGDMLVYRFDGWYVYSMQLSHALPLQRSVYKSKLSLLTEMWLWSKKHHRYYPAVNTFRVFNRYLLCILPGKDSLVLINENGKQTGSLFFPYNSYPFILWSQEVSTMDSSRLLFLFHNYGMAQVNIYWRNREPSLSSISNLVFEGTEFISAIRDRQDNWWMATAEQGIKRACPYKQNFQSQILVTKEGAIKSQINSFSRYENNLWIATYGDGFFQKNLLTGKTHHQSIIENANNPWPGFIWHVKQVHRDSVWVATQVGLFWYYLPEKKYGRLKSYPGKPEVLDSVAVTTQFTDSYGLTWMGLGLGNGVCYFDAQRKIFKHYPNHPKAYPFRYPTHIAEDKNGNLWFTSDASPSLVFWNRKSDAFKVVALPYKDHKKINPLVGLLYENDSVLWIGTFSSGLLKYNIRSNTMKIYGHDRGIANSNVSSVYQDSLKRIWLGTLGALTCFDPSTEMFTNFNSAGGLPVDFTTAHFYYDKDQHLLYNGGNGAYFYFNPNRMDPPRQPQKTMITGMLVNGKSFLFDAKPAGFKPSQNDITIHYAAIDLTNGAQTNYAYRLIGVDTAWVMAGNQRQINFSNLAPGNYTFMVRACNNMGAWSDEIASLQFYIKKPFSKPVLFYAMIIMTLSVIFYALYRFRLRELMRTEKVRTEISRNLHDEVGSTLTNISLGTLLVQKQLQYEPSLNRILERIYQDSQHVSQSMREIVWSINPKIDTVGETLPRMLNYASEMLEAKNIELKVEIGNGIGDEKLSMQKRRDLYLVFKEAVNNLAKHSNATIVQVRVYVEKNILFMMISDNGIGFDSSDTGKQNGLRNMKERARTNGWRLWVLSTQGKGTTIQLEADIA